MRKSCILPLKGAVPLFNAQEIFKVPVQKVPERVCENKTEVSL